eukprot:SAG22_NODE_16939_length_314_cov_0.962791_1_plen_91_part_01
MLLFETSGSWLAQSTRFLRIARIMRLARLSKMAKLRSLKLLFEECHKFLANLGVSELKLEFVISIFKLVMIMLGTVYVIGCVWLHVGRGNW